MRSDTHSGRINDVRKSLAGGRGGKDSCRCCWRGCCVARGAGCRSYEESSVCARLASDFFLVSPNRM